MAELNSNHPTLYQKVWRFTWPAIISNISVPLLGLVDAAVLGHLPAPRFLGGVAVGSTLFTMLFWAFGFLRMGTTGLVSQSYGRRDHQALRQWLLQSAGLALTIAFALVVLHPLILTLALPVFDASAAVSAEASIYFSTRIYSAPAVLLNYAIVGWLIGVHRPLGPLYMLVVSNSINILLDLVFVLGLGMETQGAALATVIADYCSLGIGLLVVRQALEGREGRFDFGMLLDLPAIRRLLVLNRHLFVRTLCMLFVQAFFTSQGARLGDDILAANALLLNMLLLISSGLDGFAHAAEALTGEALGRRQQKEFRAIVRATGVCSFLTALLFLVVFTVGGSYLIGWLTDIPEVAAQAREYLPWLAVMPLFAVWCYWLDGVFIGAVRSDMMQHTLLVATIAIFLPAWFATQSMGNHGLWLAYTLFIVARGAGLGLMYQRINRNSGWLNGLHH